MQWDPANTQEDLTILNDGCTLAWRRDSVASWLASQTTARLAGGSYSWDFIIEDIADRQIGVGIMLDPPDWGFFRYLGAGRNAWSYDAYEGAIVTETEAIYTNLPCFDGRGSVSVHLDLEESHTCVFEVGGVATPAIQLPEGCVVIPAACLLKKGQVVTLANFHRVS